MFAPFPHGGPRAGIGQRSRAHDWGVIIFLRVHLSIVGDPSHVPPAPPLPMFLLGDTGTINVPTVISPIHFEKVVSKIAVADLDLQFEGTPVPRGGDVTAPGSDVFSFDLDLADGYQPECFCLSPQQSLITIFTMSSVTRRSTGTLEDEIKFR